MSSKCFIFYEVRPSEYFVNIQYVLPVGITSPSQKLGF